MERGNQPKPVIGVTGPDRGGLAAWWLTAYAVRKAGGKPVRIRPKKPLKADEINGLVLGGGADVDPALYGGTAGDIFRELSESSKRGIKRRFLDILIYPLLWLIRKFFSVGSDLRADKDRDDLEYGLLEAVVQQNKPVLGICRGAQLINIYFGGTLYQDVTEFYSETPQVHSLFPKKRVFLRKGSKLFKVLGARTVWVNAMNSQAVKDPGKQISVAARELTQVVQGVEHKKLPFVIGVQWHPEYLPQIPRQRELFRALVRAARGEGIEAGPNGFPNNEYGSSTTPKTDPFDTLEKSNTEQSE